MNYKIRITAENQAIVKRIADENGMNLNNLDFSIINWDYEIDNNIFRCRHEEFIPKNATELSTEQFIELFDKKETELDKWLKETKAKNLSLEKLKIYITNKSSCNDDLYKKLRIKLDIKYGISLAEFLFNQWNNSTEESPKVKTEWQPKRGDRVLVWDSEGNSLKERIFLIKIDNAIYPIVTVGIIYGNEFNNGEKFGIECYKHMKPLPIEQPKETDFKSKVIEFIEKRIEDYNNWININISDKNYSYAYARQSINEDLKDLLTQIKEL